MCGPKDPGYGRDSQLASSEDDLRARLRRLSIKWLANANHPMLRHRPEERALLERCADDLYREIVRDRESQP